MHCDSWKDSTSAKILFLNIWQVLVLAVLGILHFAAGALTKVSKQTYFMQLSVEKSFAETQKALDDMEALLEVRRL